VKPGIGKFVNGRSGSQNWVLAPFSFTKKERIFAAIAKKVPVPNFALTLPLPLADCVILSFTVQFGIN
jgi:hypothetical protein